MHACRFDDSNRAPHSPHSVISVQAEVEALVRNRKKKKKNTNYVIAP